MRYYRSARIFTGVDETSFATAFAVAEGRFTWVGEAREIPPGARVEELGAGVVLPGLIDAHLHPTLIAMTVDAVACTVPEVKSIADMIDALARHPSRGGGCSQWIRGWGYDESKLVERRTPTRHDLDRVSTTQPVHVLRSDCHSGICNTRALELAGITRDTPDPPGARFGREEGGSPNGVLQEHEANQAVMRAIGTASFDAQAQALARTSERLASRGIVACTDMFCIPGDFTQLALYRAAQRAGFRQLARIYYHFEAVEQLGMAPIAPVDRSGRIAVGGIKLFMDGTISNRTAWMRSAYRNRPDEYGMRTTAVELLPKALRFARESGIQIAIHAMGDRAVEEIVEVYGNEEPWLDDVPSIRIEHASVLSEDLIARIASARMTFAVITNVDFFFAEIDSYQQNLSDAQYARAYPVRDLYAGVPALALSSDAPATTWSDPEDPFMSIQAAVTRRAYDKTDIVTDQAITVPQAVLLYTGRSRAVCDLPGVGMIAPGFEASFATVSEDIFAVEPESIMDLRVTGTWIQGEQVHG